MALHSDLPIYKVAYDLSDLAIDLVRNMPRDVKGVIGGELRDQCLTLIVLIYRANVARDKVPHLTGLIERLQLAELRWKNPRRIFVNSMSDLFHESVPFDFICKVIATCINAPQHTFQILTKRPARMLEWSLRHERERHSWPAPNVWLGVSVEDQERAEERIPLLLQTPAAVRWVSAEPLLGPLDLQHVETRDHRCQLGTWVDALSGAFTDSPRLDWVVVGGESGPGARPFDVEWTRSIIRQAKAAGVPLFVKQLGSRPRGWCEWNDGECVNYEAHEQTEPCKSYGKRCVMLVDGKGGDMAEWPLDLRVREFP